jgi:hypothetical protein
MAVVPVAFFVCFSVVKVGQESTECRVSGSNSSSQPYSLHMNNDIITPDPSSLGRRGCSHFGPVHIFERNENGVKIGSSGINVILLHHFNNVNGINVLIAEVVGK